jgi:hypothetical protein
MVESVVRRRLNGSITTVTEGQIEQNSLYQLVSQQNQILSMQKTRQSSLEPQNNEKLLNMNQNPFS